MRSLISAFFIVTLAVAGPLAASAQDARDDAQVTTLPTPTTPVTTLKPPAREPEKLAPPKFTNVQIEITISDQLGNGPATKKTVSLITSDGSMGRIRSRANARPNERTGTVLVNLNVDARPRMTANDLIQLELTIEYQPLKTVQEGNAEPAQTSPTELNQSLTVLMTSGKSLVVSQAADPVTDRKIVVEAKATILK